MKTKAQVVPSSVLPSSLLGKKRSKTKTNYLYPLAARPGPLAIITTNELGRELLVRLAVQTLGGDDLVLIGVKRHETETPVVALETAVDAPVVTGVPVDDGDERHERVNAGVLCWAKKERKMMLK